MLTERILEELSRNTPRTPELVKLAWPSLSTESKIQIIDGLQQKVGLTYTPSWLMHICIEDDSALVRYWAARKFQFCPALDGKFLQTMSFFEFAPSTDDKELRDKAINGESELVRATVDRKIPSAEYTFSNCACFEACPQNHSDPVFLFL